MKTACRLLVGVLTASAAVAMTAPSAGAAAISTTGGGTGLTGVALKDAVLNVVAQGTANPGPDSPQIIVSGLETVLNFRPGRQKPGKFI